jgi:hypothetical protein
MADEFPKRIDLPGGQWADLRDPHTVTRRLRRPIEDAMGDVRSEIIHQISAANEHLERARKGENAEAIEVAEVEQRRVADQLTRPERAAMREANEAAIVALVAGWSFGGPVTMDAVLDLPGPAGDALQAAVAPLTSAMFLSTTPDPMNPNRTAPGGGSPESATPSTAVP